MTYSLVLQAEAEPTPTKDIGENVFLADLSDEYSVFLFYYPAAMGNEDLEGALRGLGDLTGKNLLVNMGKLNDPAFSKIIKVFDIRRFPVIVVTATADLAGPPDHSVNTFLRLDDDRLLADPPRTVELVQEIYALFLRGEIADAISKAQWKQRTELLRAVAARLTGALRKLAGFVADRDFKISLVEGSFELVKSSQ